MRKCFICKEKIIDGMDYERIYIRPLKAQSSERLILDDPWLGLRFEFYVCEKCFCHLEGSRTNGKLPMFTGIGE